MPDHRLDLRLYRDTHDDIGSTYDTVVIGSGIGGLAAAALLQKAGRRTLVLESNHLPGGCCSSYERRGVIYEAGATTLVGLDSGQPLRLLLDDLGEIDLPLVRLDPSQTVWLPGEPMRPVVRHESLERWIDECERAFGPAGQRAFWTEAYRVGRAVWRLSGRNRAFPPVRAIDWLRLPLDNDPRDLPLLRYLRRSTASVIARFGLDQNADFLAMVDEQLMITAQATADQTPFLYGAAGVTYANFANYYLRGGMIALPERLMRRFESLGGAIHYRQRVTAVRGNKADGFTVETGAGRAYRTRSVLSNVPIWNVAELTDGRLQRFAERAGTAAPEAWGAFLTAVTLPVGSIPADATLHHQIILPEPMADTGSRSVFVSLSHPDDSTRAPTGLRVASLSTHCRPESWFGLDRATYRSRKAAVGAEMLAALGRIFPALADLSPEAGHTASPVTFERWIGRSRGRVGGLPQRMDRTPLDQLSPVTPVAGFYLCGDTAYPGQGIPGVVLSGQNAAWRILRDENGR